MNAAPAIAPTPTKKRTALSAIRAEKVESPLIVLVHGLPGLGKTTFASQMPKPLFICAETHGADELEVARYPDALDTWDDVLEAVRRVTIEEHDYKSLVIDMIDDIERLAWEVVTKREGKGNTIEEVGGGWGKGTKAALDEWRRLLSELERMISKRNMNVFLLAHSVRRTFKDPQRDSYERWEPNIAPNASAMLVGWAKNVLFVQEETTSYKGNEKKVRGVSTGARVIRTRWNAAYDAKNRYGLPDPVSLDGPSFLSAVKARQVAAPVELRELIAAKLEQLADPVTATKVIEAVASAKDDTDRLAQIDNRLAVLLNDKKGS